MDNHVVVDNPSMADGTASETTVPKHYQENPSPGRTKDMTTASSGEAPARGTHE